MSCLPSWVDSSAVRSAFAFGKLVFGLGSLQKERKEELWWFPVPARPPLLATVRQPQLVQCVHAPVSVRVCVSDCLHVTVNPSVCQTETQRLPRKVPSSKNASGVFLATALVDRVYDAVIVTSLFCFLPGDLFTILQR